MRVLVAQFYTSNIPYGFFSEKINDKYCRENKYEYFVEKNDESLKKIREDRAFTWIKPRFISDLLKKNNCDYLLYLDIDAIFCNFNKKIEEFIDSKYDIVAAEDYGSHSVINAGVLLFKNSSWTLDFLEDWWNCGYYLRGSEFPDLSKDDNIGYYKNGLWHDQTCLTYLYKRSDRKNHIKIISNKDFNWLEYEKNFIFHGFAYGNLPCRKIDSIYYKLFDIKPEKESLLELANFYSTDKEYIHNYVSNHYEKIFMPIRKKVKRFCEIGVGNLASLKMWRDYFEEAEIVGCDIIDINQNEERIKLVKLDQSKEEELINFCNKEENFDIILDDGSHKMYDQQITLAKLFKKLKPGGYYLIEDLHTSTEVKMPEKAIFNWGDPKKITTLEMLESFIEKKVIFSDHLDSSDIEYLNNNIEYCEILKKDKNYFSVTSIIKKKECI